MRHMYFIKKPKSCYNLTLMKLTLTTKLDSLKDESEVCGLFMDAQTYIYAVLDQ